MAPPNWSYEEAVGWLYARQRLGIKLGLAKVERLLAAVGNPHHHFKSIHIAGTNGKGSVTRLLAAILKESGFRVGATTSPHLIHFTERVEINGKPIRQAELAAGLAALKPAVEDLDADDQHPTFFEIVTTLAFCHFRNAGVEWAVVETGMGGRLDATNVLRPALTIITNVDLDHQEHLGPTVSHIAAEKGGIMKPGIPCVTGATGDALRVLKARSHEVQAPMSIVGEDYQVVADPEHLVLLRPTGEARYKVGLAGAHQHHNAALAVAAVEALRQGGVQIPERALREALANTQHPGRLESFHRQAADFAPGASRRTIQILLDGAHNIGAAHALRRHLANIRWSGFHLIAGFCADKQWQDAVDQWAPLAQQVWAVPLRNPRSLAPERLVNHIAPSGIPATAVPDVRTALNRAAAEGAETILIAGSLYLAGEARALLTHQGLEEIRGNQ